MSVQELARVLGQVRAQESAVVQGRELVVQEPVGVQAQGSAAVLGQEPVGVQAQELAAAQERAG